MANRYGALTLQLKQLSNLANIGSAYTTVLTASGSQKISEASAAYCIIPRDYSTISAIESNIGQVAYVYLTDQVASGAAMDVAAFIIKEVDKTTDPSGMTVTVRGPSLEDQLTYVDLADDTIDDGAGNKDTSDIDSIMGYAPSGWTYDINGGAGTGSSGGSYFTSRGNNVLQLLIAATKQNSGDFFRLSSYSAPAKTISWRTTSDSSGVTLRMPSDPTTYDGSTTVGIITSMSEDASFEDVVTRVRPYGAGLDDGRLNITGIDAGDTGGDPAGYTTSFANNLIVNTALEASLGYQIKRDIDFSRNRAADITDATQLITVAVALWNEGITYLQERDSTKKFYNVQCIVAADLRPGQTVSIVYTEYEGGVTGGSAIWTVNDSFYIHEVTNTVARSGEYAGVRVTSLVVSDTLAPKATGGRILANALQTVRETTRKSNALTTPGAVPESRTITAGDGLTGGGDLSANRTINAVATDTSITVNADDFGVNLATNSGLQIASGLGMGTPGSITTTSTNSVTTSTHTHAIDGTIAPANADYVTIGNTASLTRERALTAGDGLDLTDGGANSTVTLAVDVTDILGNGLTETSNNIVLGTPTTLTVSTTNSVGASTHAHAITTSSAVSTATAVILATDSNGRLRLQGLGINGAPAGDYLMVNGDSLLGHTAFVATGSHTGRKVEIRGNDPLFSIIDDGDDHPIVQFECSGGHDNTVLYFDAYYNGTTAISSDAGSNYRFAKLNDLFSLDYESGVTAGSAATFTRGLTMDTSGGLYINDTANTFMTTGLTINQGGNADEAFALKSSDVAHGMTTNAETDTYFTVAKISATPGGALIRGYTDATLGAELAGVGITDNTVKSSAGVGYVELRGHKKTGTTFGDAGTNANLVAIRNNLTTRWIVDAEGDTHRDGTDNTYDNYHDAQLARAFDRAVSPGSVIDSDFDAMLQYGRKDLIAAGILHESGFYNESRLLRLAIGAVWQGYEREQKLAARIEQLERKLLN